VVTVSIVKAVLGGVSRRPPIITAASHTAQSMLWC